VFFDFFCRAGAAALRKLMSAFYAIFTIIPNHRRAK